MVAIQPRHNEDCPLTGSLERRDLPSILRTRAHEVYAETEVVNKTLLNKELPGHRPVAGSPGRSRRMPNRLAYSVLTSVGNEPKNSRRSHE